MTPRRGGPPGATLAELLVALTLFAAVLTVVVGVMARQWRLQAALEARRAAREQLVAGAHALGAVIRSAAGRGVPGDPGDLVAVSDTLLDLRSTIGASVVCAVVDPRTIELPPESVAPPALSWRSADPQPGDLVLFHADAAADAWPAVAIDSVGQRVAGCAGSPLIRAAERTLPRDRLHFAAPLPVGVRPGTPVRLVRRVRYSHYRASDGRWYLGEREFDGIAWTVTQPLAGPLRSPGALGGLSLVARDSSGASVPTASLATAVVRWLDVALRADVPNARGDRGRPVMDTLAFRVRLRDGG